MRAGAAVAVLAVSGALLLSACSSSSGSSGSSAADGTSSAAVSAAASASGSASNGKGAQAMEAYRQCLSQHGVTLPTFNRPSGRPSGSARPSGRPSGQPGGQRGGGFGGGFGGFGGASPDAATQKALDACKSLRPQFTGRGGGAGGDSSAFQAFTSCLKDHGVTLSTPSPGATSTSGGRGFGALRGLNTADPKTAKAYTTCKPLLPTRPTNTASPSAT